MLRLIFKPILDLIIKLEIRIMSSLDNLKTAVAQIATDQAGISADVQAVLQKLSGLSASTVTDADLDALTAQLTAVDAGLSASKTAIDAALSPTSAPTPSP